jgi:hypothetical protein
MDRKLRALSDADIASTRAVSRRTLLGTLGLGALAVASAAGPVATHAQTAPEPKPEPKPKPKRHDPCRDSDHGPSDTDGCGKPPTS